MFLLIMALVGCSSPYVSNYILPVKNNMLRRKNKAGSKHSRVLISYANTLVNNHIISA